MELTLSGRRQLPSDAERWFPTVEIGRKPVLIDISQSGQLTAIAGGTADLPDCPTLRPANMVDGCKALRKAIKLTPRLLTDIQHFGTRSTGPRHLVAARTTILRLPCDCPLTRPTVAP